MHRLLAAVAAVCLLSGCATQTFITSVNGYVGTGFAPTLRHAVVPLDGGQAGDLQFAEVRQQVERALGQTGLQVAATGERPDVGVFVDYGIGAPRIETAVLSLPVWGQTGVSSSTTTGTINRSGSFNAVTTNTPSYGVVGTNNVPISSTVYDRFLTLNGFDLNEYARTKEVKRLWQIKVTSSGSSGDLRLVIPYLLASAVPYIGKSTGRAVDVNVLVDSPNVAYLRTGAAPPPKH